MPAIVTLDLMPPTDLWVYPARMHGAACALVEPASFGHRAQRKPFSVGPLVGRSGLAQWRLGWLADPAPRVSPKAVQFGPHPCAVVSCEIRSLPFAELASSRPAWSAELDVISPLYFSRNGRDHPLPDPVLALRSTLDRWNAFAPEHLAVPSSLSHDLLASVRLAAMDGRTASTPVTATMHQTGFVGTIRLALGRDTSPTAAGAFTALMRFADIAGIGAQTTHGFGAVRLLRVNTAIPARSPYRSTSEGPKTPRSSQPRCRSSADTLEVVEDHP